MNNQVFYTVISGTLVFVLGQILQRFLLEPIKEYKKTVGKIDNKLKFYSNVLTNPIFSKDRKMIVEITDIMRTLSCEIESAYKQIPLTSWLSKLKIVERKKDIAKVAQDLIFLSNAGGRDESRIDKCDERINEIRRLLKIEPLES
jgi:hypothetical protein